MDGVVIVRFSADDWYALKLVLEWVAKQAERGEVLDWSDAVAQRALEVQRALLDAVEV